MSDLNKIINEQRERIAELEQENALLLVKALPECNYEGLQERIAELKSDKEALDRENSSLANLVKNSVKRAEAAEKRIAEVERGREVAYENWQKKYQYLKDSMTLTRCYECGTLVHEVSPRSRCCMCEYGRATFNERDNEQLRQQLNGASDG